MLRTTLSLFGLFVVAGCDRPPNLVWGHLPHEPSSTFAAVLAQKGSAETKAYEGASALLGAVRSGEVSFALVENPDRPIEGLALVSAIYPSVLHILISKNLADCSAPIPLDELLHKGRVFAGTPGSASHSLLAKIVADEWLPGQRIKLVDDPFEPYDILFQFGGILPNDALRRLANYCLASIGAPDQIGNGTWADSLSFRYPQIEPFVLPAGLYPALNRNPVLTISVTSVIVTRQTMEEGIAYDAARLVYDTAHRFSEDYPMSGSTIMNGDLKSSVLPIHPGALRFAARNAPTWLERYAESAAFIVTALVALSSAIFAAVRIQRQRKKDRIDKYLNRLLEYRASLRDGSIEGLAVVDRVTALQEEVTRLVVEERINADSAYVAFLSLSNQIIAECE